MVKKYANTGEAIDPQTPPEPDNATLQPDVPSGKAVDASQRPTLAKLWDNWTSRPENNAAMINFGLNMMQPIAPGQSRLGHFAESIGAGAEASQRNIGAQEERQKTEEAQALKEEEAARKSRETDIYGQSVANQGQKALRKLSPLEIALKTQASVNSWARSQSLGLPDDITAAINKRHPEAQGKITKADIISNPQYLKEVGQIMSPTGDQYTGGILGGGTTLDSGGAPAAAGRTAPTPTDIQYVRDHPEARDKFIARFGVEP